MNGYMPKFIFTVIGISTCWWSGMAVSGELKPYFQTEAFLMSSPISLEGVDSQWRKGSYRGGDYQYGSLWSEAGVKKGNLSISGIYRQEYQLKFSPDTADYYYGVQHHKLDPNRTYQVNLEISDYKAKGLRAAKTFQPVGNLSFSLGGSVLQASGLQAGQLTGSSVSSADGKDHNYSASVNYQYDQDHLFDRPNVQAPQGLGYALDANLHWQATPKLEVDLAARDLLGEIQWSNVPFTDAQLTSNVKTVGADGFTKIKASLSGKNGYKDTFKQVLKPKLDAKVKYQIDNQGRVAMLAIKHVPYQTLVGVGGEMPVAHGLLNTVVWPESKLITLEYSHKHAAIAIGLDNVTVASSHAFWLGFSVR